MPRESDSAYQSLSAKAAEALGMPTGIKFFSPLPFGGMDQEASRLAIADQDFAYLENFVRTGDGNLRAVWDVGSPIYTAPAGKSIVYHFFYTLKGKSYAAAFLSDGTAVQIDTDTNAVTTISPTGGAFYSGGQLPACGQWGALYLLIANNDTPNSYWVWDGSLLFYAGTLGPAVEVTSGGSGYSSAPTVTAFSTGSGSGVAASATISNGSVVSVQLTNPGSGFIPGEQVQFLFSGGGTDTGAELKAVLTAGVIASVSLIAGGSGYTPGTYALGITGDGAGATGTYTVSAGGVVVSVALTAGGHGYTGAALSFPLGGGANAAGVAALSSGTVASVTIVQGGSGFTATPTLTFGGGGGTGAEATVTLTAGVITAVAVTAGGTGYDSAPAVIVQSGMNNAATAVGNVMPFGVSGSSIETYLSRVWLFYPNQTGNQQNGGTFLVSAPGSLTDFSPSSGGVTYTSSDAFLRYQYTNAKQSGSYLYPIGDSSTEIISNVQTAGSPPTTSFSYQNVDPQTGTSWRDSVCYYAKTVLLANPFGVHGLYGGAVTKISQKMDDVFDGLVLPKDGGVVPSAALTNLFGQKLLLLLVSYPDFFTGVVRNVMVGWDEKRWYVFSQSVGLTFISTQEVASNLQAWGTDGVALYPLFTTPNPNLNKVLSTKLYGGQAPFIMKQAMGVWAQARDFAGTGVTIDVTLDNELGSFSAPNSLQFLTGTKTSGLAATETGDVTGVTLGVTMSSASPDFALQNLSLGYVDVTGLFGSTNLTGFQGE